jgi:hypothetical protein
MNDARERRHLPSLKGINTAIAHAIRALAILMIGTAAAAQTVIETGNSEADTLIRDALAEQRVFITCSSLDQSPHAFLTTNLIEMAANSAESLRRAGVAEKAVARFVAAATPAALMPAAGTSFAEVLELCDNNPDWADRFARLDFILLDFSLRRTFGQ